METILTATEIYDYFQKSPEPAKDKSPEPKSPEPAKPKSPEPAKDKSPEPKSPEPAKPKSPEPAKTIKQQKFELRAAKYFASLDDKVKCVAKQVFESKRCPFCAAEVCSRDLCILKAPVCAIKRAIAERMIDPDLVTGTIALAKKINADENFWATIDAATHAATSGTEAQSDAAPEDKVIAEAPAATSPVTVPSSSSSSVESESRKRRASATDEPQEGDDKPKRKRKELTSEQKAEIDKCEEEIKELKTRQGIARLLFMARCTMSKNNKNCPFCIFPLEMNDQHKQLCMDTATPTAYVVAGRECSF
jgi:hypothetical protein